MENGKAQLWERWEKNESIFKKNENWCWDVFTPGLGVVYPGVSQPWHEPPPEHSLADPGDHRQIYRYTVYRQFLE